MNVQTTVGADYGYLDFILIHADHRAVTKAVIQTLRQQEEDLLAVRAELVETPFVVRALARLGLGNAMKRPDELPIDPGDIQAFTMFDGTAGSDVLFSSESPHDNLNADEAFRVSSLTHAPDWTLIELRETVSGLCLLASSLSETLDGTDVLYFRKSGRLTAEPHFDFHVYQATETVRRVLCRVTRPTGDPAQARWEGTLDGYTTEYEPQGMYPSGIKPSEVLNNAKIDAILAHNGLSHATLFRAGAKSKSIVFARKAGGAPMPG